jgi:hypothetical protein
MEPNVRTSSGSLDLDLRIGAFDGLIARGAASPGPPSGPDERGGSAWQYPCGDPVANELPEPLAVQKRRQNISTDLVEARIN